MALAELEALHAERILHLTGAVLLTRNEDGEAKVHGDTYPAAAGAVDGGL